MARKTIKSLEIIIKDKNTEIKDVIKVKDMEIKEASQANINFQHTINKLEKNQLLKIELTLNPNDKQNTMFYCGIKQFIDIVKNKDSSTRTYTGCNIGRLDDKDVYDILTQIADEYKPLPVEENEFGS